MSYKQKLAEARKLIKTGCLALYDRVSVLIDVFNDREFRVAEGLEDDGKAADYLTEGYLPDTDWDFLNLRALMEFAPNREKWGGGKLKRLYAEMIEARRKANTKEGAPIVRNRVTKEEYEKVQLGLKHAEARATHLQDRVTETLDLIERLRTENRELREENALLKGRIQELERMLTRELAAA